MSHKESPLWGTPTNMYAGLDDDAIWRVGQRIMCIYASGECSLITVPKPLVVGQVYTVSALRGDLVCLKDHPRHIYWSDNQDIGWPQRSFDKVPLSVKVRGWWRRILP